MSNFPFSPDDATFNVFIKQDPESQIPRGIITFDIYTERENKDESLGLKYVSRGCFEFTTRQDPHRLSSEPHEYKTYDITPGLSRIYYNDNKEIIKIELFEYDSVSPEDAESYDTIINFFTLVKDVEALNAFRILSWYWTSICLGFSFLHSVENGNATLSNSEDE
jgi:hypothetical protein